MSSTSYAAPDFERRRHIEVASRRQHLNLIIIDSGCRIIVDSIDTSEREWRVLLSSDRKRMRREIDAVLRSLIEECERAGARQSRVAFLDSHRFVRVTRLEGSDEQLYAVTIEFFRGSDSLSRAARKYQLTPREIDVLAMIIEGSNAVEMARTLQLAETTVQGYFKRLLIKTQSRNRPAMVANVLGWGGFGREGRDTEPQAARVGLETD
jgi:DNA-binding CsgD family transcriptional regulator